MRAISNLRNSIKALAQASLGLHKSTPRYYAGQASSQIFSNQVLNYPALGNITPIQDLNPTSPTFGKLYFMAGYSVVGGSDPIYGG